MTIALGMLHSEGVLICADTLVSGATLGGYQSKIQAYKLFDGDAIFAFAGNVGLAESAIQQCEGILKSRKKKRGRDELANAVRGVLAQEYKTHIANNSFVGSQYDYSFIVAVRSEIDGIEIYSSQLSALVRSRTGFESIGAGHDAAEMLIRAGYKPDASRKKAWNDAAYAIATIRRLMPGCVGGEPILMNLERDGGISVSGYNEAQLLASYGGLYDVESRALLETFLNTEDDAAFATQLGRFTQAIPHWRDQWKKQVSGWSAPPSEVEDAFIDLS